MPNIKQPEVKIGDFKRTESMKTAPIPTKKAPATPTPKEEKLASAEATLEAEVSKAEDDLEPLERYEQELRKAGVSKEEAATIIDDVLMRGYYAEDMPVTKKLSVTFRTRSYSDTMRVNTAIEVNRPAYETGYQEIVFRYYLAASMEKLGAKQLDFGTAKSARDDHDRLFHERLNYIESLPELTVQLLFQKLSKFDEKMRTVLQEACIENF